MVTSRGRCWPIPILGLMALALGACSKPEEGQRTAATVKVDPVGDAAHAAQVYAERCAACHGVGGQGDGPSSASLRPKPRSFDDTAWQGSTTDDAIRRSILLGGVGTGRSVMMPASHDLEERPGVVDGLVKIVRGFGHH
jgi:mono/diheme cytochrome c family protein